MIERILPASVSAYDTHGLHSGCSLFAQEELAIERAVPKRRREFAAGRNCARKAITKLGLPARAILAGINREPIWPSGTIGSITHCEGYCAAAVARKRIVHAIGIDAEPNQPLPSDVAKLIVHGDEWSLLHDLPAGQVCWDRLLFSVKETLYKAWFPVEQSWLGFEDARVSLSPQNSTFVAQISRGCRSEVFRPPVAGRFMVTSGFILTSFVIHH